MWALPESILFATPTNAPNTTSMPWGIWLLGVAVGAVAAGVAVALWTGARRKQMVRRVRLAESRARRAEHLAEIGAMTGGLAHEIKNPLSTIGLNADLLGESIAELPIDEAERSRLSRRIAALRREADRLHDTLSDFLDYAGEKEIQLDRLDLNDVVDELVDFFYPQCQAAGVRLRADRTAGSLAVMGDRDQLKQALLNLLLNAVQAMTTADRDAQSEASIRDLIVRTSVAVFDDGRTSGRVEVIDTGPGIGAEHAQRVFVPYFTTKPGGSGLGLPTTRRIVHAMGGEISVDSVVGRGTRFTIDLPTPEPTKPSRAD